MKELKLNTLQTEILVLKIFVLSNADGTIILAKTAAVK